MKSPRRFSSNERNVSQKTTIHSRSQARTARETERGPWEKSSLITEAPPSLTLLTVLSQPFRSAPYSIKHVYVLELHLKEQGLKDNLLDVTLFGSDSGTPLKEPMLPNLPYSPEQLFWISFGQNHCLKMTPNKDSLILLKRKSI